MREFYADINVQPSIAQPSLAERLELIAQRLEIFAWLALFAFACYAGFLIISM
jgi:hypothetical protein